MTFEWLPEQDGVLLLRASGEVDVVTTAGVHERVAELVRGATGLVLDLSAVTFFDSSGVTMVDRLARACRRAGAGCAVVAPPGTRGRRVLEVVGMAAGLVHDDLPAARAAAGA